MRSIVSQHRGLLPSEWRCPELAHNMTLNTVAVPDMILIFDLHLNSPTGRKGRGPLIKYEKQRFPYP